MNTLPLITLGIPIYNAAGLIERTLLSALNQTYPNIEFIFVDDKGDSMDIVRRVAGEHPRGSAVRIIDQVVNHGTGAARNTIVEKATGEYLFTMDCDDVLIPECIELLYNKMQEHPVDFVAASFVRRDLEGKVYPGGCQYEDTLITDGDYAVAKYRYGRGQNIFVATWNKLYRTDFLRKNEVRCIPHYLIDDPWFTYQVILRARSCRLLPDCTLFFTYNPQSVTSLKELQGYSEFLTEQYIGTQLLKSGYIHSLTGESFYNGLMLDIMKMSLYHANRVYASACISPEKKRQYLENLLSRHFSYPSHWHLDKNLMKLLPFLLFYMMPMAAKKWLVGFMVNINLKDKVKRWLHF